LPLDQLVFEKRHRTIDPNQATVKNCLSLAYEDKIKLEKACAEENKLKISKLKELENKLLT